MRILVVAAHPDDEVTNVVRLEHIPVQLNPPVVVAGLRQLRAENRTKLPPFPLRGHRSFLFPVHVESEKLAGRGHCGPCLRHRFDLKPF